MGVFRGRRSTVSKGRRSKFRSTRRLVSRLTPNTFNLPFGSGKVELLAFHAAWSSSIKTRVAGDRASLAASFIHHSGT